VTFNNNHAKILTRLSEDRFYSSSELSADLGLSRTTIWKYLHSFSELGLEIIAVSGKGYRLKRKLELLSVAKIKKELKPEVESLLSVLEIHSQIASTNNYLLEAMKINNQSGYACFAESQTNGRGRQGRQWVSPFGSNIYLSLSWVFENGFASLSGLSLAIGVVVVRALTELGIDNIGLKWPNDIYWQDKKLGGILIEISGESSGECIAIIGLGLNMYLPEKTTATINQPWTDLDKISPKINYSRNVLSSLLLNYLLPVLATFETQTFKHYL
jgi:BirA family biotin operon repressor/biotin-[acetyl-CoA-carboxylase] ligase